MKKKTEERLLGTLLAGMTVLMLLSGCAGRNKSEQDIPDPVDKEESSISADASTGYTNIGILSEVYDPDEQYYKYVLVDYSIDDIGAEFTATVSAKEDNSEYEVHCMLENVEQVVVLDGDLKILSDLTGDMEYDAPLIVQKAIEQDDWQTIDK